MDKHRVFKMSFASVYPLYVQKAVTKGRKKKEVEAPKLHPNASKITGVICGVRIEEIEDPLMRTIRRLDKLVDDLAKGRPMEKILRE